MSLSQNELEYLGLVSQILWFGQWSNTRISKIICDTGFLFWLSQGVDEDYAPGTQKNVSGEVIRWNNISGPEKIDAKKYIELLEAEIEELNRQVGRKSANEQNEILEYLKSLEPQNLKAWERIHICNFDLVFINQTCIQCCFSQLGLLLDL